MTRLLTPLLFIVLSGWHRLLHSQAECRNDFVEPLSPYSSQASSREPSPESATASGRDVTIVEDANNQNRETRPSDPMLGAFGIASSSNNSPDRIQAGTITLMPQPESALSSISQDSSFPPLSHIDSKPSEAIDTTLLLEKELGTCHSEQEAGYQPLLSQAPIEPVRSDNGSSKQVENTAKRKLDDTATQTTKPKTSRISTTGISRKLCRVSASDDKQTLYTCDWIVSEQNSCGLMFKLLPMLKKHILNDHGNIQQPPFVCKWSECKSYESDNLEQFKEHINVHTLTCKICKKTMTRPTHLIDHMNRHYGIKRFVCELCDVRFFDSRGLSKHKKEYHVPASGDALHQQQRQPSTSSTSSRDVPASDQLTSIKEEESSDDESIESKARVTYQADPILQEVHAAGESGEDISIDIPVMSPDLAPQAQLPSSQGDNDIYIQRMLAQLYGLENPPQTVGTEISQPTSSSDTAGIQGASVLSGQQSPLQAGCSHWGSRAAASKPASPSPAQHPLSLSSQPGASSASGKSSHSEEASLKPELIALAQMLEIPKGSDCKKSVLKQCMDKVRDLKEQNQSLINKINMNQTVQANEPALGESLTAIINESHIMLGKIDSRKQSCERQSRLSFRLLSHLLLLNSSISMLRSVLIHEKITPSEGEATTLAKHYLDGHLLVWKLIRTNLNTVKNDALESRARFQELTSTVERLKSYTEKYNDLIEGQSGELDDAPLKTE